MSFAVGDVSGYAIIAVSASAMAALVAGGVLISRRRHAGVVFIRIVLIVSVTLTLLGTLHTFRTLPTYASYWSTPGTALVNVLQMMHGLWVPILLTLLTLRPAERGLVVRS